MATKGIAVAATSVGVLFLWSAVKGTSITGSLQDIISGKKPSGLQTTGIPPGNDSGNGGGSGTGGDTGAATHTAKQNQALAKLLLAPLGFTVGDNWTALLKLWNKESDWSNTADNPSSGAYGIAQALPASKYPKAGRPPSMGGRSDATAQILWGGTYILRRYGNPQKAWDHEVQFNWY